MKSHKWGITTSNREAHAVYNGALKPTPCIEDGDHPKKKQNYREYEGKADNDLNKRRSLLAI